MNPIIAVGVGAACLAAFLVGYTARSLDDHGVFFELDRLRDIWVKDAPPEVVEDEIARRWGARPPLHHIDSLVCRGCEHNLHDPGYCWQPFCDCNGVAPTVESRSLQSSVDHEGQAS